MLIGEDYIKYTNQRIEILNFLKKNKTHPSVDEVYEVVKKKLTRISKATVYKNLKYLTEQELIREVNVKGVSRFEYNKGAHHHIICKNCSKIIDFESEKLIKYSLNIIGKVENFKIDSTSTNFYGYCKNCKGES